MSQHDMVIDNAPGGTVRGDVNNAFAALVGQNSGATAPATTYAYMFWADTTTGKLKQRNAANSAWIEILPSLASTYGGLLAEALLTTRGDIITRGASAAQRLAVGTAGQSLGSDGTDVAWVTPPYALGNRLINGEFAIWQRGTSLSSQADDSYGAMGDRWYILTQTGTIAGARQDNPFDGARFSGQLTQSQASAQRIGVAQIVEGRNCINLRGQAVTFYGRFKISADQDIRCAILEWTGAEDTVTSDFVNDWTSSTYTASNFFSGTSYTVTAVKEYASPGTGWVDFFITGTLGSSVTNLVVFLWTEGTAAQNVTLSMANCGLVRGSVAPPKHEPRPFTHEMLLCQRYYWKSFPLDTTPAQNAGRDGSILDTQGGAASTSQQGVRVRFPTPMRAVPTCTGYNPAAANAQIRNVSAATDWSGTTFDTAQDSQEAISFYGTSPAGSSGGQGAAIHATASAEL